MSRPSRFAFLLALALGCGAPTGERLYASNDLQLVGDYTAKNVCSCLFVMEQTEDYCRAWVKANPSVARVSIDRQNKAVTSAALLLWGSTARYVDDVQGCVSDP